MIQVIGLSSHVQQHILPPALLQPRLRHLSWLSATWLCDTPTVGYDFDIREFEQVDGQAVVLSHQLDSFADQQRRTYSGEQIVEHRVDLRVQIDSRTLPLQRGQETMGDMGEEIG